MTDLRRCLLIAATGVLTGCFMPFVGPQERLDFPSFESWEKVPLPTGTSPGSTWKPPDRIIVLPPRIDASDAQASERAATSLKALTDQLTRWGIKVAAQKAEDADVSSTLLARLVVGLAQTQESNNGFVDVASELHLDISDTGGSPLRFTKYRKFSAVPSSAPDYRTNLQMRASRWAARALARDLYSMVTAPGIVQERRVRGTASLFRVAMGRDGRPKPGDKVSLQRIDDASGQRVALGTAYVTRQVFGDHIWLLVDDKLVADSLREGDQVLPQPRMGLEDLVELYD